MTRFATRKSGRALRPVLPVAIAALALMVSAPRAADAENVIGPDASDNSCNNCHVQEYEAWKQTHHFSTFALRHQSEEAKQIQTNLGIKSMKREGDCVNCHYTSVVVGSAPRPKWGVSCESCHGAGKAWNDTHNKTGGDPSGQTLKWGEGRKEAPDARAKRLSAAKAKGMIAPDMIYGIASNCFGCHTVPNETLVNKGKHKAGSDFDLVAWSQGEVRHNFLSSSSTPPKNPMVSKEELRRLYVVGAMVDLEVSLRNLANVKEKGGDFHKAMVERVNLARKKVEGIQKAQPIPELATVLEAVPAAVDASTSIKADLADQVGKAAKKIAESSMDLSKIDSLLPTKYKGEPFGA